MTHLTARHLFEITFKLILVFFSFIFIAQEVASFCLGLKFYLCLQHFHEDFLPFDKESMLDPATDTCIACGPNAGSADKSVRTNAFRSQHQALHA